MPTNHTNKEESSYQYENVIDDDCTKILEKKVIVTAQVTVKPRVILLEPDTDCCEPTKVTKLNKRHSCKKRCVDKNKYKFVVEQELCLRIPLQFNAEIDVEKQGIVCDINPEHCKRDNRVKYREYCESGEYRAYNGF